MAGNSRGRLKEHFEGVHKNFEWAKNHIAQSIILTHEHHKPLTQALEDLNKGIEVLDELAMGIYARI